MHLKEGTKIVFDEAEVVAMASSGILTISIGEVTLAEDQAFLLRYLIEDAAEVIEAVSSSGYELDCRAIDPVEEEWTFMVVKEPESEEPKEKA